MPLCVRSALQEYWFAGRKRYSSPFAFGSMLPKERLEELESKVRSMGLNSKQQLTHQAGARILRSFRRQRQPPGGSHQGSFNPPQRTDCQLDLPGNALEDRRALPMRWLAAFLPPWV